VQRQEQQRQLVQQQERLEQQLQLVQRQEQERLELQQLELELQQVCYKQLKQVLIKQLIERNVSFLYPLRYELKLNQLRRTTFSPTECHEFYQQL
jgi:hypothetical protein